MTPDDKALLTVLHAESHALGEANATRLTRMLGLIAVGLGGLAGVATLVWRDDGSHLEFAIAAPFIILLIWLSCARILIEMRMASTYRLFFDAQIEQLLPRDATHGYRSWQDAARRRGKGSLANFAIFGFAALCTVVALGLCAAFTVVNVEHWLAVLLLVVWTVGIVVTIAAFARIEDTVSAVAADLRS